MNLIEQLEALQVCFVELSANKTEKLVLYDDLRAIIEQAKREAVESVAVPEATQQDHTKLIEQLLAVIAKKDEALIKACELIEKFSLQVYNGSDCLRVYDALALQPADVELVEVERVRIIDGIPTLCGSKSSDGKPAYTIKTKE